MINKILSKIILKSILKPTDICCLCFMSVDEDIQYSIKDEIIMSHNNGLEASKILSYILLGSEVNVLENYITTDVLCKNCFATSFKCYTFIKQCKENMKCIMDVVDNIDKCLDNDKKKLNNFKTVYLTMTENHSANKLFMDTKDVSGDSGKALKRFQKINQKQQNQIKKASKYMFHSHDSYDSIDFTTNKQEKKDQGKPKDNVDTISKNKILLEEINQSTDTSYKCRTCLRAFPRMHNLKRHYLRVHAPKDYPCSKCNKSFGSISILKEHQFEIHSGTEAVCQECGKVYAHIKSLKIHELSHKLSLKCDACGKIFNRKNNFKKHVTSKRCVLGLKRSNVEKKYICDHCNKKYTWKATLRVHIQFDHGNGQCHICSWCGKKLSSLSKLKAHSVTHTHEKKFSCNICGGCYVSKESLLYHTRIHTGEKPYKCDLCDQQFLSISRRTEHMNRHHREPALECDICHSKFKGRAYLLRHKKRHYNPNSRLHYTKLTESSENN